MSKQKVVKNPTPCFLYKKIKGEVCSTLTDTDKKAALTREGWKDSPAKCK